MSTAALSFKCLSCLVHCKLIGINCVEYLRTLQEAVLFLVGLKLSMQDDFNENQNYPCGISVIYSNYLWLHFSLDSRLK